jgi:hypothetical protein
MTLPTITDKQKEIMVYLYRFRFLDRSQIQKLLKHNHPSRIKAWLKDLTEKNITGRHFTKSLKDNKPAVYFLSLVSKKILQQETEIKPELLKSIYREKHRSSRFVNHSMFLADIYLYLKEIHRKKDSLSFYTKRDLERYLYLPDNKPDAYIAVKHEDNNIKRCFLEIIDEDTPRFVLRRKILSYIEYFDSSKFQNYTKLSFPSLLWVCPDQKIKKFLYRHIIRVLEEEAIDGMNFFLATKEEVVSSKLKTNVWQRVEETQED